MGAGAVGLQEVSWGELSFASVAEGQLAGTMRRERRP